LGRWISTLAQAHRQEMIVAVGKSRDGLLVCIDSEVEAAARMQRYGLYLLLAPTIPWHADGTRIFRQRRGWFYRRIRERLDALGAPCVAVTSPTYRTRLHTALDASRSPPRFRGPAGSAHRGAADMCPRKGRRRTFGQPMKLTAARPFMACSSTHVEGWP
jgi:hypothetical protein